MVFACADKAGTFFATVQLERASLHDTLMTLGLVAGEGGADGDVGCIWEDEFLDFDFDLLDGKLRDEGDGDFVGEGFYELARAFGGEGGDTESDCVVVDGFCDLVIKIGEGIFGKEGDVDEEALRSGAFLGGNTDVGVDLKALDDDLVHERSC